MKYYQIPSRYGQLFAMFSNPYSRLSDPTLKLQTFSMLNLALSTICVNATKF